VSELLEGPVKSTKMGGPTGFRINIPVLLEFEALHVRHDLSADVMTTCKSTFGNLEAHSSQVSGSGVVRVENLAPTAIVNLKYTASYRNPGPWKTSLSLSYVKARHTSVCVS
jgi:hypothetical protein